MDNKIPVINRRTSLRREGTEWLLLTPGGKLLVLNDTAKFILDLCDGRRTTEELCGLVRSVMKVPKSKKIEDPVDQLLANLEKAQCVFLIDATFSQPTVGLRHSTGVIPLDDVHPSVFSEGQGADPPCQ